MKSSRLNCLFTRCKGIAVTRGYCEKHYDRIRSGVNSDMNLPKSRTLRASPRRLASKDRYQDYCTLNDIFPGIVEEMFKAD